MAVQGPIKVRFEDVFPAGVLASSVEPVRDFDASQAGREVQAVDKTSGMPLWAVHIYDLAEEIRERDRSTTVKIPAAQQPALPDPMPGTPFRQVEFDELTVTPYVGGTTQRPRVAYSLRARSLRPVSSRHAAKASAA